MGLRRLEDVAESAERLRVTAAIERGPLRGPRAEDAIEEKEGNAEVLVHESLVVECPVMDVVGLAGGDEPAVQPGIGSGSRSCRCAEVDAADVGEVIDSNGVTAGAGQLDGVAGLGIERFQGIADGGLLAVDSHGASDGARESCQ
jgi:hypothetical protein